MQLLVDQNHQDTDGSNMTATSNTPNYKTQLCHQWLTNGQCPRGQSCNYAHGTAEIRQRCGEGPATLYKNSLCRFWQSGSCGHGDHCNYAHGLNELRTTMSSSTRSTLSSIGSSIFPPAPSAASTSSSTNCQKDPQFPLFHPTAPNAAMFMSFMAPSGPIPPFPPPPSFMAAHPPPIPQTLIMSNPQPSGSYPFTALWGQPLPPPHSLPPIPPPSIHPLLTPSSSTTAMPIISSPTSLNSLLKRDHFQPFLTGGCTNSTSFTSNKTILQQPADEIGYRKKENDNEGKNTNKSSPTAIGSTKSSAAGKLAENLMSTGQHPPLPVERHRSRSSSIPSKSNIPLPFTMAQIAQQFENVNFFDGSSKEKDFNTAETPDFNTSNDADFPSLNCATKKEEGQKEKDKEKQQKSNIDEAKTLPTPPPPIEQPKSFAKIAAKTPIAFAAAAMANKTKSSKVAATGKHSASAGTVISVQQQKCGIKHLEGMKKPSPAAPPPPSTTLALVNKAIKRPVAKTSTAIVEKTTTSTQKHANSVPSTPFLPSQISSTPPPPITTSVSTNQKNEYSIGGGLNKFDDLFEKAPFLNHARNIEESMFKSIEGTTITSEDEQEEEEEEVPVAAPQPQLKEEEEEVAEAPNEWQTVVSTRHRKSSLNTEYLSHRPSPCTDDGYQEGFSSGDEYGHSQQTIQNCGMNGRMADSPASISQQSDGTMIGGIRKASAQSQQQQSSNEPSRLDKSHIFYRTHICLFWQNYRDGKGPPCKHGENCFYAHGEKKLIKLNPMYFKTTLCEAYNNDEQCPYGNACNFAHGEKDLRKPAFNGIDSKKTKFFSVPHRHQLRKQRGIQTVHCVPTISKPIEKVVVIKTNPREKNKK